MREVSIDHKPEQGSETSTILQRIAQGNVSAVNECLDTYGKLVWAIAKKFTNTREDAEDLTQEIFIDIWKNAAYFDETKSPEQAFVRLIARRRLIDSLRKTYRRPQILFVENPPEGQLSDAHQKLQIHIEAKSAVAALNKLSRHEHRIIKMSIYEGISHREIAGMIGLPLGTVKTHIRRSLQKIKTSMELPTRLNPEFRTE